MNNAASVYPVATCANTTTPSMVSYDCQVIAVMPLSADTIQVELQSPAGAALCYRAGQYLQLEIELNNDGQAQSLFYSIANGFNPDKPRRLQLFIQNTSELADQIIKRLWAHADDNTTVKVTLPMGRAFLQTDLGLSHLLVAAGSGISQIKCLAEAILTQKSDADVNLYWSNKNVDDFFLADELRGWLDQNKNLKLTFILESANANWQGRCGYIYQVIEQDFDNLDGVQTYLCGSPQMVYGTIDKLKAIGLKEQDCYSDVFEYAPRINQDSSVER
ncbi:MAG: NAD(P)H-flavin reductase [Pseudomonadota bacterium]